MVQLFVYSVLLYTKSYFNLHYKPITRSQLYLTQSVDSAPSNAAQCQLWIPQSDIFFISNENTNSYSYSKLLFIANVKESSNSFL